MVTSERLSQSLVFIDSGVDDLQTLVDGVVPGARVVVLPAEVDGVELITQVLRQSAGVTSVHIVSHGAPGCLYLGKGELSLTTLDKYTEQLKTWFASSGASLALYGCQVAAGDAGEEFLSQLHFLTQAQMYASAQKVGHFSQGGTWALKAQAAPTESLTIAFTPHTLATYPGTFAPGDLDTSFGTNGVVTTDLGADEFGWGITTDAAGNILVTDSSGGGGRDFRITRYTSAGVLDTSFGTNGSATIDLGASESSSGITTDAAGNILVSGQSNGNFVTARYTSAGVLDTSFGTNGVVTRDFFGNFDRALDITTDAAGNILVSGLAYNGSNYDIAIARYTSAGVLDTSFGTNGVVTTDLGADESSSGITTDAAGNILVTDGNGGGDFRITRYTSAGVLDTSFGTNGSATIDLGASESSSGITTDAAGNLLVTGSSNNNFVTARLTSAGVLDTSFGTNGVVTTDLPGNSDTALDITTDAAGNILVSGRTYNGSNYDIAIVRYEGTPAANVVNGSSDGDVFKGTAGTDQFYGLDGKDSYKNVGADDTIIDTDGLGNVYTNVTFSLATQVDYQSHTGPKGLNLHLRGTDNIDGTGDDFNNLIFGNDGNNVIYGGGGADLLKGGLGIDTLYGETGNDILEAKDADTLIGGTGDDTYNIFSKDAVVVENASEGIDTIFTTVSNLTLADNVENLILAAPNANKGLRQGPKKANGNALDNRIIGNRQNNSVQAGDGNDSVWGSYGNDVLKGQNGNDRLFGEVDDDKLIGGAGNDYLIGGSGNDTLTGGKDQDTFVFSASSFGALGIDVITDWAFKGTTDIIQLDSAIFSAITFETVATDATAETSTGTIVYSTGTGNLFYNTDGAANGFGGGGQFATLNGAPTLSSADFTLV